MNCKPHRSICASLLFVAALTLLACSKSNNPEAAATPTPAQTITSSSSSTSPDQFACGLLTREETQAVQGEPFKSTKASQGPGPGFRVSQCYFELPTPVNSVVLTVTRKADGANARDPRESWHELFYGEHPRERDKEREKDKEGEEKGGPQKVEGVGEDAFWSGSRVGGALYVLKGESYFRISVGGAGDQAQKLEKSKTLAAFVLKRL